MGPESDGPFPRLRARTLFRRLGFTEFESIDISAYEGCTLQLDLNSSTVPELIKDEFDFVYNGGTLEHVFHLPNALGNVFDMLKVGGAVVHCGPHQRLGGSRFLSILSDVALGLLLSESVRHS